MLVELGRRLGLELPHLTRRHGARRDRRAGALLPRASRSTRSAARAFAGRSARPRSRRRASARRACASSSPATARTALAPRRTACCGSRRVPNLWASWDDASTRPRSTSCAPRRSFELNPPTPTRLGVATGDAGRGVRANGHAVDATVRVRAAGQAPGTALLTEGTAEETRTCSCDGAGRGRHGRAVGTPARWPESA